MNWMLFKCLSLIYHGLVLFSLALLNVSLAIIISVFTLPVYCILQPRQSRYDRLFTCSSVIVGYVFGCHLFSRIYSNVWISNHK